MHVQIVTFTLGSLSEEDYLSSANDVAGAMSSQGGLLAKVWLDRQEDGTYGACYLWRDRESMERFVRSGLFEGNNSELQDVASQDFAVLRNLTKKTQPELELVS
jgi:heme-degrading monooxygenase HmoA